VRAAVLLLVTYGAFNSYYGFVYAALQDIVPPGLRGTAMAVYFLGMYALGGSYGPLVAGRLSDLLARRVAAQDGALVLAEAHRALGLQQALLVIPAACLALAAVLYMGSRTIEADMVRREAVS
jgi:MFS family permease